MKKIKYIFILLILFLNCACQKIDTAYVKGTVVECGSEQPIANATISLIHGYKDKNGAHSSKIIETTTSDEFGNYKIKYHKKIFNNYWVECAGDPNKYFHFKITKYLEHTKQAITFCLH